MRITGIFSRGMTRWFMHQHRKPVVTRLVMASSANQASKSAWAYSVRARPRASDKARNAAACVSAVRAVLTAPRPSGRLVAVARSFRSSCQVAKPSTTARPTTRSPK